MSKTTKNKISGYSAEIAVHLVIRFEPVLCAWVIDLIVNLLDLISNILQLFWICL